MAQSVIVKKEEKVAAVVASLPTGFSEAEFVDAFIKLYPNDWDRVQKAYRNHESRAKLGKTHPMPEPRPYLSNSLKIWRKKQERSQNAG
ncbi:MAG TPA: hypothetical protein DCZ75_11310 [Geobacter sp.]|nr:hypothetical protein [Geobacter sp.]